MGYVRFDKEMRSNDQRTSKVKICNELCEIVIAHLINSILKRHWACIGCVCKVKLVTCAYIATVRLDKMITQNVTAHVYASLHKGTMHTSHCGCSGCVTLSKHYRPLEYGVAF